MKKLELKKSVRTILLTLNILILVIWSSFIFIWYIMVIAGDIPPAPTVYDLYIFEISILIWFLIVIEFHIFLKNTTNKPTV